MCSVIKEPRARRRLKLSDWTDRPMKTLLPIAFCICAVVLNVKNAAAQGVGEVTPAARAELLQHAQEAIASHPTSPDAAMQAFGQWFSPTYSGMYAPVRAVVETNDLSVEIITPIRQFAEVVLERIRRLEPLTGLDAWTSPGVALEIQPKTVDGPDIVKVLVEKDGSLVQPTLSKLESHTYQTKLGRDVQKIGGVIYFPLSAFDDHRRSSH
jgi:hypothetical protein